MNPKFSLSYLGVIIGSLVWTSSAQQDFESARTHIINIFGDPSVNMTIKASNELFLLHFLERYSDQISFTPSQRNRVREALRENRDILLMTSCTPDQNTFRKNLRVHTNVLLGIEIASWGINNKQDNFN